MYINIIHIFPAVQGTEHKKRQHEQSSDPVRFNIECKAHEKRVT